MDEDQREYRVFLHPRDEKMWAIGRQGATWKTLWGATVITRVTGTVVTGAIFHFSHSGTVKVASAQHMTSVIEKKLAKGHVEQAAPNLGDWLFRLSPKFRSQRKYVLSLPAALRVPSPAVVREAISTPAIPLVIVDTAHLDALEAEGSVFIGF